MQPTKSQPEPESQETRQRLIEAAGQVFAEAGFRAARVRDICDRASANIAAVNYYFGDKGSLYSRVLNYAHTYLVKKYPLDADLPPEATPQQRLRAFVRAFLSRIFAPGEPSWHGRLVAREILEPTGALEQFVKDTIRPQAEALCAIVHDLSEGVLSEEDQRLCSESILGQCLLYRHARSVLLLLGPEGRFSGNDLESLTRHIARFSLAGIRDLVAERKAHQSR